MRGLVELGNPGGHCGAAGPTTDLASHPRDTAGLDTAQGAIATPLVGGRFQRAFEHKWLIYALLDGLEPADQQTAKWRAEPRTHVCGQYPKIRNC